LRKRSSEHKNRARREEGGAFSGESRPQERKPTARNDAGQEKHEGKENAISMGIETRQPSTAAPFWGGQGFQKLPPSRKDRSEKKIYHLAQAENRSQRQKARDPGRTKTFSHLSETKKTRNRGKRGDERYLRPAGGWAPGPQLKGIFGPSGLQNAQRERGS